MSGTRKALSTLCVVLVSTTTACCKDQTARDMAKEVADVLVDYGDRNGIYLNILHDAVCNLDLSIWDPGLNPDPDDATKTLIHPKDPPVGTALCPPGEPVRGEPPDDPEDPFDGDGGDGP